MTEEERSPNRIRGDISRAKQLENIAKKYNFPLQCCNCGENYEIEDVLREASKLIKKGKVDLRWTDTK